MSEAFSLGEEAALIRESVQKIVARGGDVYAALADMGLFSVVTESSGAKEAVAAMEVLGAADVSGPLVEAFVAMALYKGDARSAVESGARVAVGEKSRFAHAVQAARFIVLDGAEAFEAISVGKVTAIETLGQTGWGKVALERRQSLGSSAYALALGASVRAAYLAASGQALVATAAEHARTRTQFGRAIGDYQGVSHPLADAFTRLFAAGGLARRSALALDAVAVNPGKREAAIQLAASARKSAAHAALFAGEVAFQTLGALGITLEGPLFGRARRLRDLTFHVPTENWAEAQLCARLGV